MRATEGQAAARALIAGDEHDFVQLTARLSDADMYPCQLLLEAALALAATRRFGSFTDGELIRYVARIRAGTRGRAEDMDLDPLAAEAALRRALGQPAPGTGDPWMRLRSVVALLRVLVSDLELDEAGVDGILAEARTLTDWWLAGQSS